MRTTELLRLVWLNIVQNKFKSVMTSIGIVVGAATIVMVIAIGRGGQMDVAEQFSNLNAGAIDVSYEWSGEDQSGNGSSAGGFGAFLNNLGNMFGGAFPGRSGDTTSSGSNSFSGRGSNKMFGGNRESGEMPEMSGENREGSGMAEMPGGNRESGEMAEMPGENQESGEMPEMSGENRKGDELPERSGESEASTELQEENGQSDAASDSVSEEEEETEAKTSEADTRMNQAQVILTKEDAEDIATYVPGLEGVTISYTSRASVEGGTLTSAQTYTVAGVKENYEEISKLVLETGSFLTEEDDAAKNRVCVLGASVAKELFGSALEAYDGTLYIEDRAYTIIGVLASSGMVSAGITADDGIFVPYETGIKYIAGETISPVITVISEDINALEEVTAKVETVLAENYSNAEFTYSDAGSKMEAAESSNEILEVLLTAMAVIVFLIGGIGIMNVLFVSVRERTNEIGILKSLGASQRTILFEFLIEAAAISLLGGILGVALSFGITPVVEYYGVRVEPNMTAWCSALVFAVLTGTLFGIYPAWKASRLVPVEALNAE